MWAYFEFFNADALIFFILVYIYMSVRHVYIYIYIHMYEIIPSLLVALIVAETRQLKATMINDIWINQSRSEIWFNYVQLLCI